MNAHCERIIQTLRHELCDHVLILNEAHARRLLASYRNTTTTTDPIRPEVSYHRTAINNRHRSRPTATRTTTHPHPRWTDQPILLHRLTCNDEFSGGAGLAKAEPKALRYRLLHVAARLTRGQHRVWLRIQRSWPWAHQLTAAFTRLAALPVPAG